MGINYMCPECGIDGEAVKEATEMTKALMELVEGTTFEDAAKNPSILLAKVATKLRRIQDLLTGEGPVFFSARSGQNVVDVDLKSIMQMGHDEWMEEQVGKKVSVKSGDGKKDLGQGTLIGLVDVWFVEVPGSLRSAANAEKKPSWWLRRKVAGAGGTVRMEEGNPKIRLDSGEIVYGCQVWWSVIEDD